jgi:two-component system chemotaxis response regulator CheB
VSTGGPQALATVLPQLPANLPVPVLIVQHMPPLFTRLLADRLDASSLLRVSEAVAGDVVEPGRVLIAPGDFHLRVRRGAGGQVRAALDQGTPENFCRPAVDVLFRSAVEVYGGRCLAVVLTGMGSDGARGAGAVVAAGGEVLAQDERTSVVWGMPGATVAAGHVSEVLPLDQVARAVVGRLGALAGVRP